MSPGDRIQADPVVARCEGLTAVFIYISNICIDATLSRRFLPYTHVAV